MQTLEIAFSSRNLPSHEDLAAAWLAALGAIREGPIAPTPSVKRINEDYGSRQEEFYTYGDASLGLEVHAVGLMSGHGRHGSKTTWRGVGVPVTGESQLLGLGKSYVRIDFSALPEEEWQRAGAALEAALQAWDLLQDDDGDAIEAVDSAIGKWQTATGWDRSDLIDDLRRAEGSSPIDRPAGATVRFLLARLLLAEEAVDAAAGLLEQLRDQGPELAFSRGLACGLDVDGSLWYVYRPSKTPPPQPHLEVLLALAWVAELRGATAQAAAQYQSIVDYGAELRGGIRPDRVAEDQLKRLASGQL
ncbi:MAG: hypothetical protein ACI8S6_004844 [Myxococcota bacterium]|jgi:hypothetical protein